MNRLNRSLLALLLASCATPARVVPAPAVVAPDAPRPVLSAPVDPNVLPLGRLSRDVVPASYEVELEVTPSAPRFSGRARIAVTLARSLDAFWLHGRGLDVSKVTVRAGDDVIDGRYEQRHEVGVARVSLARAAPAGAAVLEFEWSAPFGERAEGLFHVEVSGRHYAFTQFEPLFARRMLPCFDEPSFKVPMTLAVNVPRGQEAISNAPAAETRGAGKGRTLVRFAPTLPLPTYLLMLAVGPLDVVSGADLPATLDRPRKLSVRGAATKGLGPKLQYSLSRVGAIVEALERQLGPFPYPKLDLVAVPNFAAGAMENAGAVTYREWLLLMDGKRMGVDQRRAFESVTAHELAHQWFGDLVTMQWWDDLWLNEAFATWMEDRIMDAVDPEARASVESAEEMDEAMAEDSMISSRKIRQEIASHHDVDNAFDGITYRKGAAVLRMFERWIGREKFDAGLRKYLAAHAQGNATAADFLAAISEAAGRDVAPAFSTFLDQPGVPLVNVSVACGQGAPSVQLAQRRWLPLGSDARQEGLWKIPMCLRGEAAGQPFEKCVLLESASQQLPLELAACPDWVMPNANGAGYFRFVLDDAAEVALSKNREKLDTRELLALSDSLAAGYAAGAIDGEAFFRAVEPLAGASERLVSHLPMEAFDEAREVFLAHNPALVEARARKLFASRGKVPLGPIANEKDEASMSRAELASFLLDVAREPVLRAEAKVLGEKIVGFGGKKPQPELVEPALEAAVVAVAVEEDGVPMVEAIAKVLKSSDDPDDRRRALAALGHASGEAAVAARKLALDPAVRGSELRSVVGGHFSRPGERAAAWAWFTENFDAIVAKVPEEFVGALPWFAGSFCTEEDAVKVEAFFRPRIDKLSGGPRNLDGAIEAIRLCTARVARHGPGVMKFFSEP